MTTEIILQIVATGVIPILTQISTWLREKYNKGRQPGLNETAKRAKQVEDILAEVQSETGAFRVQEWIVSNGDKSLSGHSIQKLSMFSEVNSAGVESIASTFQMVPATILSRNLIRLANSQTGFIITDEGTENDDLSQLHRSYGVKKTLIVKISTLQGKWTGMLFVAFDNAEKTITEAEIAFAKLKASQLGVIPN